MLKEQKKWTTDDWSRDTEVYSTKQVEAVAESCGINIVSETDTHFLAYCPFHINTYDPAFAIDKSLGLWTCFNPSCASGGTLEMLVERLKGYNKFETLRLILEFKNKASSSLADRLEEIRNTPPEFVAFPTAPLERMRNVLWQSPRAIEYLHGRGFTDETLEHFDIAYSDKKDIVLVPMHDPTGMLVGFVGRAIYAKEFRNSDDLPKSKTAWNYHRAKKMGDTVIICESSFDAMRVHQAGYPNVIALLGGHASSHHLEQINTTFSSVIVMTDFDKRIYPKGNCKRCRHISFSPREPVKCLGHRPGRDLGHTIADGLPNKSVYWAAYDDECIYPHGAKDAGDMTDDEIRQCLHNTVSNFEYTRWGIEDADLSLAS